MCGTQRPRLIPRSLRFWKPVFRKDIKQNVRKSFPTIAGAARLSHSPDHNGKENLPHHTPKYALRPHPFITIKPHPLPLSNDISLTPWAHRPSRLFLNLPVSYPQIGIPQPIFISPHKVYDNTGGDTDLLVR